jgi:hypothetical protein
MNFEYFLKFAALCHLGLLAAGLTMPRAVGLRKHLTELPPFIRRLFWVYYMFVGFVLVSFGVLTWTLAGPIAAGLWPARALTIVMALFWIMRLGVGAFVLDERPYVTNWFYRCGFFAINLIFLYLVAVYGYAALFGGCL